MKGRLFAVVFVASIVLMSAVPNAAATSGTYFVNTIGTSWNSAGSAVAAAPGDQGLDLTVTFQFEYPGIASSVQAILQLTPGFSLYDGSNSTFASVTQTIPKGEVFQLTFESISLASNLKLGSYALPLELWAYSGAGLLFSQNSNVTAKVQGKPQLSFSTPDKSLTPGQVNQVELVVTNKGTGNATDISTTVTSSASVSVLSMLPEIKILAANASTTQTLDVYAPPSSAGSSVTLTFNAEYTDTTGASLTVSQALGMFVAVASTVSPVELAVEPTYLQAGATNNLTITISNMGASTIDGLSIAVAASATVSVLNALREINALSANASTTQTLDVYAPPSSAGSPVTLTLDSTYTNSAGTTLTASQALGMFVAESSSLSPVGLTVSPTYLQAGATNNLTITIFNTGTSTIDGLSASFSPSGGLTWLSPALFQTASMAPGSDVTVQAQLYDPSSSPAAVQLQVPLKYAYQNSTMQETRSLGLLSRGVIDIEMTGVTVLPQVTSPGQVVSVTLTITNVGVIEASGVTAQAQMPAALQPIGSASDFIGDMQVDSPYTFTLSAIVTNSTAAGTYGIPVTLSYLDNLRSHLSETLNVTVTVGAATSTRTTSNVARQSGFAPLILLTYVVFAAAVLVLAVLYLRQRRLSKSLNR